MARSLQRQCVLGWAVYTPGISERRSSTTKFYGTDRLGTNSLETNSSQTVTATKNYDAFGMLQASTGPSASPFGFAGKHGYQEDGDSGLKLLGHRYYDASTGRFLTRDRIKDGRNWYAYAAGNPLRYTDPTGHNVWTWIKDRWYDFTREKEPIDIVRPPAAVLAAGLILFAIWELADHAHGVHEPPGGNPTQPGLPGLLHPKPGDGPHSDLPPESNIRMGRTAKNQNYWLDLEPEQ